jgi:chloride channel 3/4/5
LIGLGAGIGKFFFQLNKIYLHKLINNNNFFSVAGVVDIGSQWTSSLKSGFCYDGFWFNREQCCWISNSSTYDEYRNIMCESWISWKDAFKINFSVNTNSSLDYFVSFIFYLLISLLYGLIASVLVKCFAPYACGSGVPEIKTILSGFVCY